LKDLFVLVADIDIERTIKTLLQYRRPSLDIKDLSFDLERYSDRDSGLRDHGLEFIRNYQRDYKKFILVFDYEGCGADDPPETIRKNLLQAARKYGFNSEQIEIIIIKPEFEIWVWKSRHHLGNLVDWNEERVNVWLWQNFKLRKDCKPEHPKEIYNKLLSDRKKPISSENFEILAKKTGLKNCQDPAFQLLVETLRKWFPKENNKKRR